MRTIIGWAAVLLTTASMGAQSNAREQKVREQLARDVQGKNVRPNRRVAPAAAQAARALQTSGNALDELIATLDTGSHRSRKTPAYEAHRQLDGLGILAFPALYAALDRLGPFGQRAALDLLAEHPEPRLYEFLKRELGSEERSRQVLAAGFLSSLPKEAALPLIELASRSSHDLVRYHAVAARVKFGADSSEVVGELERFLGHADSSLQSMAWYALRSAPKGPAVVRLLERMAQSPNATTHENAVEAWLGKHGPGDEEVALAFYDQLTDNRAARRALMEKIIRDGRRSWPRLRARGLEVVEDPNLVSNILVLLTKTSARPSVEVLSRLVASENPQVRSIVASYLVSRSAKDGYPELIERIVLEERPYDSYDPRSQACGWLARAAPERVIVLADELVRRGFASTVAPVLAKWGGPQVVPVATRYLREHMTDSNVVRPGMQGIVSHGAVASSMQGVVAHRSDGSNLKDILDMATLPTSENPSWGRRLSAAQAAFSRWLSAEHVDQVLPRIFEIDAYLAEPLLAHITEKATPAHVDALARVLENCATRWESDRLERGLGENLMAWKVGFAMIAALGRLDNAKGNAALLRLLSHRDDRVRLTAFEALLASTQIVDKEVLGRVLAKRQPPLVLQKALERPWTGMEPRLRDLAVARLLELPADAKVDIEPFLEQVGKDARGALVAKILASAKGRDKVNTRVVQGCLEELGNAKSEELIPEFATWARHPDSSIRYTAVEQLGRTFSRKAVPHLIEALKDDEASVTGRAEGLLTRFEKFFEQETRWRKLLEKK